MKRPDRQRVARFVRAAAVNCMLLMVSFIVAAGLAELAIRLIMPQQLIQIRPDLWQPADTVGWLHRPNVSVHINTGERDVTVHTDADGYRVGSQGRLDADTQVLLIGDSFMEALQVEHEQSVAYLLEQSLSGALGRSVAVRNSGVAGWGPSQYLLRARTLLQHDSFALIVVAVFVGNDASMKHTAYFPPREPAERRRFRLPRSARGDELKGALLAPLNDALETRSHLFVVLKNQLSTLRMRLGLTAQYFPNEYRLDEAASRRWDTTADIARQIAEDASAHGTPTLFVLVPEAFQVYPARFTEYVRGFGIDSSTVDIDQPGRLLLDAFLARGLCTRNLLSGFRYAADAAPPLFGEIDQHLSPAGHTVMTSLITPVAASLIGRGNDGSGACASTSPDQSM